MAFPTSPSNNDIHKEGNRAWVYDSTLTVWNQVPEFDPYPFVEPPNLTNTMPGVISRGIQDRSVFPPGSVIHMKHLTKTTGGALSTSATPSATTMHTLAIRTTTLGSKLYVVMHMSPQLQADGSDGSFTMRSSVDNYVANLSWGRVFRKTYQNYVQWHSTITYLHDHDQPIGTEITYKSYLSATGGQIKLGDYWGTTGLEYAHQATVIMEIAP